jgi:hypothetical protein
METLWKNDKLFIEIFEEEKSQYQNIQSFAGTIDTEMSTEDITYYKKNNIPLVFQGANHKPELGAKLFGPMSAVT